MCVYVCMYVCVCIYAHICNRSGGLAHCLPYAFLPGFPCPNGVQRLVFDFRLGHVVAMENQSKVNLVWSSKG